MGSVTGFSGMGGPLLVFTIWAIVLTGGVAVWRVLLVLAGRKASNDFPSGTKHGSEPYWRLNRAQINTLEYLPVFGVLVGLSIYSGMDSELTTVAWVVAAARIAQSSVHMVSGSVMAVNIRFTFLIVQWLCWIRIAAALAS